MRSPIEISSTSPAIGHADAALIADYVFCGERELIAIVEHYLAVFKSFDSVFRTLCVEHYRYRKIELLADFFYHIELFELLRMGAVGEVEPRNIETRFAHLGEYFRVAAGGSYRAYNLRLSHGYPFIPFYINQIHYIIFHLRVQYSRVKTGKIC